LIHRSTIPSVLRLFLVYCGLAVLPIGTSHHLVPVLLPPSRTDTFGRRSPHRLKTVSSFAQSLPPSNASTRCKGRTRDM
jgi:hypothetical protein